MDTTNGIHHAKPFPVTITTIDPIKLDIQDDDDDGEEDFILLQMPLVPKKFTLKQEIKIEEVEDDINIDYLYPEEGEIIEECENEEYVPSEGYVDNTEDLEQQQDHEQGPEEDSSERSYEEQKAELEQKIKDVKVYYSLVSSMCNKLDAFIKTVTDKLAFTEQLTNTYKKVVVKPQDLANSKCSGWTHVFGTPYFKDKQFFYAPKNYDVAQKEQKHEINISSLPNAHLWKPCEKHKIAQVIKKFEVQKRISFCRRRIKDLSANIHDLDNEKRSEVDDELTDLRNRQKLIEQLSLAELVHGRFEEYDWLKISVTDLCNQHSPEECRNMWFAYLHPDINRGEWTTEEKNRLNEVAAKFHFQNWPLVAEELGTGRSAFQCIRFYQMNLNDNLIRRKWTEDEDQLVQQTVERCRVGTFIPWARVAANIEGRTKVQVFNRWKYCLEPSIRKGRFTEEEDLMILAAMRWYGRNFQQISRFIPGRTPVQLRDRYNASLENTHEYVWNTVCDEKLMEMVEEFGISAWSFISKSFPGFSRVQIRHRYYVVEKWRDNHDPESFPPVRNHPAKRHYDDRLEDVLGSYIDITEERAAIMGDKPLFQIQNKLGLQHRKKRGRPRFRAKRTRYTTALDTLFLKHFSVSYHCHRSTSKRFVNKEVIEEDGRILKSLLTIFNAALSIPDEEDIKMHFELRNCEDECLVKYLRDGTITSKKVHIHQEAGESVSRSLGETTMTGPEVEVVGPEIEMICPEEDMGPKIEVISPEDAMNSLEIEVISPEEVMTDTEVDLAEPEVAVTNKEVTSTDSLHSLLPKKCNYSLAMYVSNKDSFSLQQKRGVEEPMQICTETSGYNSKKGSAASSLSTLLPKKCTYSLAQSFMGNVRQHKGKSSLTSGALSQNVHVPNLSPLCVNTDLCESNGRPCISTQRNNAHQSFTGVQNDNDCHPVFGDSSVPIDNGITIRWCLIPNYATLICCKTLLLSNAPLSRTVDKSKKREKAEKLRQEDKACTKLTLENIIKSDDPLALQEMLTEFDVHTSENYSSEKSVFSFEEADALCKQRFVSLLLFPALASIRNLKVCDDVFELSKDNDKHFFQRRVDEEACSEKVDDLVPFKEAVDNLTANYFKHFRKNTFKENIPETSNLNVVPGESNVKKKRGRKRKSENMPVENRNIALIQTGTLQKRKYLRRSPGAQIRKSGRLPKPVKRDTQHVYNF